MNKKLNIFLLLTIFFVSQNYATSASSRSTFCSPTTGIYERFNTPSGAIQESRSSQAQ